MLRHSLGRFCAAAGASASASASASAPAGVGGSNLVAYSARVEQLCAVLKEHRVSMGGVRVAPSEVTGRGLFADVAFAERSTVLRVPLGPLAVSVESLLARSPALAALAPPSLDDVRRCLNARSVLDPVLQEQVHLALLLAAEHMLPESPHKAYLDSLPHPAVDDAAAIAAHKDVVDPVVLIEWDGYQKDFVAMLGVLLRRWGSRAPPIEVAYWAMRTVLARMFLLPQHGTAPQEVGSRLSYAALADYAEIEQQTQWRKRLQSVFDRLFGDPLKTDFRLVPTLVPLLDMAGHVPSTNVTIEVSQDAELGSCVELQALRDIEAGEEIGMRFNSKLPPAFALYRFGFIPQ